MKYDLVVVGGGPGGLMAAKTAAEDGLKVVLVERKRDPTEINRSCLQVLYVRPISPLESGKTYAEQVNVEIQLDKTVFHFTGPGFSLDYTGQLRPYLNWIQMSPGGNIIHRFRTNDRPWGFFYQKSVFVAGLLAAVEKLGVRVMTETTGLSAENTPDGVRVRVRTPAGEEVLEGRKAVAADGNSSKIVESLGLNEGRRLLARGLHGAFYIVEGLQTGLPECSLLGISVPSLDPARNILIGQMADNTNCIVVVDTSYEALMKHPMFAPMLAKAKVVGKMAYSHNAWVPLRGPVAGNVVVVGDAAAPMETWTAGAVACGYLAVKAHEKEMNGQKAYPDYVNWWLNAFSFHRPSYFAVVSDYYAYVRICNDEEVDYLFSLFKDRIGIPGPLINENMEVVKRERPRLYEKFQKAREQSMWLKQ